MYEYSAYVPSEMLKHIGNEVKTGTSVLTGYEKKSNKPAIDDVICHYLDGRTLKNALSFIDYVRSSKMKIKWSAANVWSVRYKNKHVLDLIVRKDSWKVRLVMDHMASNSVFSNGDAENVKALIGHLRNSMPENLEPIPALS